MKSQEHSSIGGRLHEWTPANWNPSISLHANISFFWLLPHDETSGRLKWWTESCLDAIEGKLSHVSIRNVLRLAEASEQSAHTDCHAACLKYGWAELWCSFFWTFRSVSSPWPSPGVVKHHWHRHSRRNTRLLAFDIKSNVHFKCFYLFLTFSIFTLFLGLTERKIILYHFIPDNGQIYSGWYIVFHIYKSYQCRFCKWSILFFSHWSHTYHKIHPFNHHIIHFNITTECDYGLCFLNQSIWASLPPCKIVCESFQRALRLHVLEAGKYVSNANRS